MLLLSPIPRPLKLLGALSVATLAAACAQPQQSAAQYDTSRENTHMEAEAHAMGGSPRASQLQLGFGGTGTEPAPVSAESAETEGPAPLPRPLAEARSFLGTVPCPPGMACEVSRFIVTLAPSGEWRARTTMLVNNQPSQTVAEQGCWDIISDPPLRIALMHANRDTVKADLGFLNNNLLRVHALNGMQPVLEHRLTRQAEIDPIDELQSRPTLQC